MTGGSVLKFVWTAWIAKSKIKRAHAGTLTSSILPDYAMS